MTADVDSLFTGMAAAPVFGRGTFMSKGNYVVEIVKVFTKKTFKGADVLICEFKILESNTPEHLPGSSGSWVPKFATPNTFGNIKELIFAIFGKSAKDVPASSDEHVLAATVARAACGSDTAKAELKSKYQIDNVDEIVIGARVTLACEPIKTKTGGDFTRYDWGPAAS